MAPEAKLGEVGPDGSAPADADLAKDRGLGCLKEAAHALLDVLEGGGMIVPDEVRTAVTTSNDVEATPHRPTTIRSRGSDALLSTASLALRSQPSKVFVPLLLTRMARPTMREHGNQPSAWGRASPRV